MQEGFSNLFVWCLLVRCLFPKKPSLCGEKKVRRKLTDLIQYAVKKEYISLVHADNASFYRLKGYKFE